MNVNSLETSSGHINEFSTSIDTLFPHSCSINSIIKFKIDFKTNEHKFEDISAK